MFKYLNHHKPHILFLQETYLLDNKILTLRRPWVQQSFHATYSNYARGVAILLAKSLACKVFQVVTDLKGRCIIILLEIKAIMYALVNVYVPPLFNQWVYKGYEKLARLQFSGFYIAWSFNSTLDPFLDSSNPNRVYTSDLLHWAQAFSYTEIWRWKHQNTRAYFFQSTTHKSGSRIDLINTCALKVVVVVLYLSTFPHLLLITIHWI